MIFINASDLMSPSWRFLEPACTDADIEWSTHSGLPRNALERRIRKPSLGRWRAAFEAVREARGRKDAMLVSHLPSMAAALNVVRRLLCPNVPQIAFAFNFTDLPTGARRRFMTWAFKDIEEFVVFSRFERELYAEHFGIPQAKIHFLPWAMEAPAVATANPAAHLAPYICAIGGEGRDYRLLAEAMCALPEIRAVIVARPHSFRGIDVPPNMTVFSNLPGPSTWAIAKGSVGMVLPLKTDSTACGHITLVGAQLLGIPLAITRSRGVDDYVQGGQATFIMPAGNVVELENVILMLLARSQVEPGSPSEPNTKTDVTPLEHWIAYFSSKNTGKPSR